MIKVETAGQSLHNGNEMSLIGIYNSEIFRDKVLERRLNIVNRRHGNEENDSLASIATTLKYIEKLIIQSTQK